MAKATKLAISALLICGVLQLTLLFYSFSHPSVKGLVTASFFVTMVCYPAIFRYHSRKMKSSGAQSSQSSRN